MRGLRLLGARNVDFKVPNRAIHGYGLSPALVAELRADVPTLLLSGTDDVTVPLSTAAERPWAEISARPAWRVDVRRAGQN